ncbi:preprotein translocase subunit YajC [Phytoactinopolyspora alkaliphila]|uniref:Preprotein translocase subunit YajC n=1 Tax=Phytoactinopolyspora alkaliphila TaxID=1783498 RepID=A0A6N9YRJ5_9ACTN|nr:preprotein translocase subunit YajC [Phytoactinopolyspora alkaliphila]NED97602.1 preprotein translocase subunit YajC [Phytoactinopolyspora alkaliphila]
MEALLLPILLIAVFYFLLIRPQQRQRRQMMTMQQTLAVGSKVMTGGGLLGTVVALDDDEVEIEVSPGVTNRYVRRAIVNVLDSPESADPLTEESLDEPLSESEDTLSKPDERASQDPANGSESR